MRATADAAPRVSSGCRPGAEQLRHCRELGDALQQLALTVDELLRAEARPPRPEVRTLRLLATDALQALGAVVHEVNDRRWDGRIDSALRAMAADYAEATGALAHVRIQGPVERLPVEVAGALRLVAIEALTNVSRHARATLLVLKLEVDDDAVALDLVDDGVGLVCRQATAWDSSVDLGLRRMNRAMQAIGGSLSVHPLAPRGMRISASAPSPARRRR